MKNQTFERWLKNHPCDTESLWLIQNCLGSLYGFDHPDAKAASKAWEESRKDPKSCRHLFERGKCIRCDTEERGECRYDCKSHPEEKPCAECKKANQGGEKDLEICFECGGVKFIGRFCECEAKECINAPQRCLIGFWCKWCKENRPDAHLNQEASERNMRAIAESFEDAKPQNPSETHEVMFPGKVDDRDFAKPSEEERWNALLDMLINYTDVTLAKANEFRSKFL